MCGMIMQTPWAHPLCDHACGKVIGTKDLREKLFTVPERLLIKAEPLRFLPFIYTCLLSLYADEGKAGRSDVLS